MSVATTVRPVLDVQDLRVQFETGGAPVDAVRGISFQVAPGERVALVGESGSGKSVTARSILGLVPRARTTGAILVGGRDVLSMRGRDLRRLRGAEAAIVMQDPLTALNPVVQVGAQVAEVLVRRGISRREAAREAVELLDRVGVPEPGARARSYPFELSGGLRQRVVIAIALAGRPRLLIADEPTTALDVRLAAQILDLLRDLSGELGMSVVLITHDLGVVADFCDHVLVMYGGRLVEDGPVADVYGAPRHPYTAGLLGSVPRVDRPRAGRFVSMPGEPVSASVDPGGCAFRGRCARAVDRCAVERPLLAGGAGHFAACHVPLGMPAVRQVRP